jgi:WD40 repeat protein
VAAGSWPPGRFGDRGHRVRADRGPTGEAVVYAADASADGRLALACSDRTIRLLTWDGSRATFLDRRLVHDRPPQWCRFDRSGRHLVSIDGDRFAWVWDWETGDGKPRECIRSADERTFKSAWFSADGTEVLTVDTEQSVERWPIDLADKGDELAQRWRLRENAR